MIPSNDDFLASSARWDGKHRGIQYQLNWHGRSEYSPQGTWCWYIIVTDEQFYPEDWQRLRLEREDRQFSGGGNWHRHWDYYKFPDVEPHGEWTFGEMRTYLGRDGKEHEWVKVGCDYAHAFDRDGGYWEGRADVERDVKRSIDLLVEMFPNRREQCAYTGRFGDSSEFYTARNGARVLKTQVDQFKDGWDTWLPADAA